MSHIRWFATHLLVLMLLLLVGCAAPTPVQPNTEPTSAPGAQAPTELTIGVVLNTPLETPWNAAFVQSLARVIAEKPHGLTITYDLTENVPQPDQERVLRQYAESGKYPIIWANSTFSDIVAVLQVEYPEIIWVVTGAGNNPVGGNAYWFDVHVHESAYLMGIIAGKMTKTNVIGMIGQFAFPNVNAPANAYFDGAKSVNPNVKTIASFIDSWFDPPKAKEAANAQIAAGADFIFAQSFGVFDAAKEQNVYVFGHHVDQYDLAPEVVITGDLILWEPGLRMVIDAWWEHVTMGKPYDNPAEGIFLNMKDGATDLAPYHEHLDKLPSEVVEAVEQARADILSGKLVVPFNGEQPDTTP